MAVQSIKSVLTGVVATFLGCLLFIWYFELGPFAKTTELDEPSISDRTDSISKEKASFSFHSPKIKFYEADMSGALKENRVYSDTFVAKETRFIYWELVIKHKELIEDTDINLLVVFREPDGNEKTRMNYDATSKAGWSSSMYTWGWGSSEPGSWAKGEHTLELFYQGNLLASKPFIIQ